MGGRGGREQRRTRHTRAHARPLHACRCAAGGRGSTPSCCDARRGWPSRCRGPIALVHVHARAGSGGTSPYTSPYTSPRARVQVARLHCGITGGATRGRGDTCSVSEQELQLEVPHAVQYSRSHAHTRCTASARSTGVSAAAVSMGATARGTRSVQVHKWRRRRPLSALRRDLSPLGVRLGFRCADLLCSEEPCNKQAPRTRAPSRDVCTCVHVCVCVLAMLRRACTRPYRPRASPRAAGRIALRGAAQRERGAA